MTATSDAPFWKLRTKGHNHIFEKGTNQWREEPDKSHILIEYANGVRKNVQETIEVLMAAPPIKNEEQRKSIIRAVTE